MATDRDIASARYAFEGAAGKEADRKLSKEENGKGLRGVNDYLSGSVSKYKTLDQQRKEARARIRANRKATQDINK